MKNWTTFTIGLLLISALAACREEAPETAEQPSGAMGGMGGMQGMEGMQDMGGHQMGGGMMEQMRAHMASMEGANGERYQAMLPQHRQMVANMISQFNREMRDMQMGTDSEWDQTVEALRQDLREMPDMGPQELEEFMPEHRQRVIRLMEMHQEMMGSMQMSDAAGILSGAAEHARSLDSPMVLG